MSRIYAMAKSDPFDRDIRTRPVRSPRVVRPRAPVVGLADRPAAEAAALRAEYAR